MFGFSLSDVLTRRKPQPLDNLFNHKNHAYNSNILTKTKMFNVGRPPGLRNTKNLKIRRLNLFFTTPSKTNTRGAQRAVANVVPILVKLPGHNKNVARRIPKTATHHSHNVLEFRSSSDPHPNHSLQLRNIGRRQRFVLLDHLLVPIDRKVRSAQDGSSLASKHRSGEMYAGNVHGLVRGNATASTFHGKAWSLAVGCGNPMEAEITELGFVDDLWLRAGKSSRDSGGGCGFRESRVGGWKRKTDSSENPFRAKAILLAFLLTFFGIRQRIIRNNHAFFMRPNNCIRPNNR